MNGQMAITAAAIAAALVRYESGLTIANEELT